jgi:hypothetical protein
VHAYKIQILHEIKDTGRDTRAEFSNMMLKAIDDGDGDGGGGGGRQCFMVTNVHR